MASAGARAAKLLLVLSNDYGELSQALDFVRGQPFEPLLLVPGRLYGVNAGRVALRVQSYAGIADVRTAVAAAAPDAVLLFSGYLYAVNRLFGLDGLAALLDDLRQFGVPAATSDPFLGLTAGVAPATFHRNHPLRNALADHFAQVYRLLVDVPHLYLSDPEGLSGKRRLSWFNPHAFAPAEPAEDSAHPRWLFVLSSEDYAAQTAAQGKEAFERTVAGLLRHTLEQGRRPVLVAPEPCLDGLRSRAEGAVLRSHCGHDAFRAELARAEHVFYWNVLPHSAAARLLNRRSAFFFAPGHLLDAIPPLAELAIAHYYAGAPPECIDPGAPPTAAVLARLAEVQDAALAPARARMAGCPTLAALVDRLRREAAAS